MSLEGKVAIWRDIYLRKEFLNKAWEIEKARAIRSDAFNLSKKISIDTGTLCLKETRASYKVEDVLKLFGSDTLINCAKVDQEKLDEYAARGFLKKSELKQFRKIIDVQEKYILMTLQHENEKRKYWESN